MKLSRQWKLGLWGLGAGMLVAIIWVLPVVRDLWSLIPPPRVMLKYNASNDENLKTLRTALMQFHETEGQFPAGAKWMDSIKNRVRVDNMDASETDKKFINPLYPAKKGVFGYGFNDAASEKYKGDLKAKTILVFDSTDTSWNAHGDPAKLRPKGVYPGGQEGITLDGTLVKL